MARAVGYHRGSRHGLQGRPGVRTRGLDLFGVLEDWDRRGVVLRHTEDMVSLTASRVENVPLSR